ncbi:MAG: hypothetical protein ABIJ19_02835 [Patescibacteria group bacterium]
MILTSHIIISGILASKTQNYFLAAAIGLISHYVLDAIPHWDYLSDKFETQTKTDKNFVKRKTFWREIIKISIDGLAGFGLLALFVFFDKDANIAPLVIGAFFGILPDALQFLSWLTNWKFIKWNVIFHKFAHHLIHKKINPGFQSGVMTQVVTIGIVFLILRGGI